MKTIRDYIIADSVLGTVISGSGIKQSECQVAKKLKYYSSDSTTAKIIKHNRQWAETGVGSPRFQFIYLMVPCGCNQKCRGCFMGQDKSRLPQELDGPFYADKELADICSFAKKHGALAAVHAGGGELFTWSGALDYIKFIKRQGLSMMIFTNGTLIDRAMMRRLNELEVALTISMRDPAEKWHNEIVGTGGFKASLNAIELAMTEGLHLDNRLCVEMPVTINNEDRVINDLLPVLRALGVVPMIEEYILTKTSAEENQCSHSFTQAREFFRRLARKDAELGINWWPEFGQRMIVEPKCQRPLFSFTVFPNGEVVDCPTNIVSYGNFRKLPLPEIIYSDLFRKTLANYQLCPCSKFYTDGDADIPVGLPDYLKEKYE
ncbi:MAG: radical SAM protein [Patescibacteria group bacterium]